MRHLLFSMAIFVPRDCSAAIGPFCLVDSILRVKYRCRVSERQIHSCIGRQIENLVRISRIYCRECQDFLICLNDRVAAFPHHRSNPGRLRAKGRPLPP